MKKFLLVVIGLIAILFIAFLIVDEKIPDGESGVEAELLTDKMFDALNKNAWDTLAYVSWSFRGSHHYVWDKKNKLGSIEFDDARVIMNLESVEGNVYKNDELLQGDGAQEYIDKAWSYWCNDSFWLMAPFKARDAGTIRKKIELEDGKEGLLVQYESGGVTPGDAYLWILDENGVPEAYKMWVSIIPIGGVKATWSAWEEFNNVKISTEHKLGPIDIPVTEIETGNSLPHMGMDPALFVPLMN